VTVVDAVDTYLRTYPASPIVLDVLGTLEPDEIRSRAFALVPDATEVFFFAASVGALYGVRRRDGSRVAVKVNKPVGDHSYFAQVHAVQGELADAGFPAPRPVRRAGTVTVDEWLDAGTFRNAHDHDVRRALANTLVRFVELATATRWRPRRRFLRPGDGVWPAPHNALFDFEATRDGAGWIDEVGRRALLPPVGREVVGHTDWAAKHLRFDDDLRPTALYDWDSVTTETEPVIAGTAAGAHTYTEELAQPVARWPTPDEALAFLDDYERARRGPFDEQERRAAEAACVYLIAYAARCHHSVGGDPADMHLAQFAALLA
jgi:hypothetical protein